MQISGYGAVSQSQWPYDQQRRTRTANDEPVRRGDTVSFSAEALELLARAQAAKNNADAPAESTESTESAKSREADEKNDAASAKTALSASGKANSSAGSSDASFGDTAGEQAEDRAQSSSTHEANQKSNASEDDIDSKIKGLKGQIEQVARQIANIYKLPIDMQQKVEMAQPLEERINQLQQEIQALEAQKAAKATSDQKQS